MSAQPTERVVRLSGRVIDLLYSWGASVGGFVALILLVILFQSIFWAAHVPLVLKLGIAALAVLSLARPADGLLVVAALAPLGYMLTTRVFGVFPARITEALVLAFLAGATLRVAWTRCAARLVPVERPVVDPAASSRPLGPPPILLTPSLLFGSVVIASCGVHYYIVQAWHDHPWPFFQRLVDFLAVSYHDALGNLDPTALSAGFSFVFTTAFVLEGVALFLVAFTFCARDRRYLPRLVTMVVAGAVGAATLSFVALALAAVTEGEPIAALLGQRWTMFTPKLNTAASLFVLAAPLALAGAGARLRGRSGWIAAASVIIAALWINGTRVAIIAAVLVLLATVAWLVAQRRRLRVLGIPAIVGMLVLGAGLVGIGYQRLYVEQARALRSLNYRIMFTQTALAMFASRPVFGVGIGQYYLQSEHFAPEELIETNPFYTRVPAHNPFLQTAAELGVVGLVTFTWLVGAAIWLVVMALRVRPRDAYLLGALAGLTAFLLTTASSGHPLLIEVTAFPFWIVLGLAAARAFHNPDAKDTTVASQNRLERFVAAFGGLGWGKRCTVLGIVLLAVSLPLRLNREARNIDFTQIAYGLHGWETGPRGVPYRWTSDRVTYFVDTGTTAIELPLRAPLIDTTGPMNVEVFLDGKLANRLELIHEDWRPMRMTIPPSDQPYRVLELTISPTWFPAALLPGSTDARELGVMAGEMRRREDKLPPGLKSAPARGRTAHSGRE